jgi:hypothetical protein
MHSFLEPPLTDTALPHYHVCGFSIALLDANDNCTPTPKRRAVIRRFFTAVGRWIAEVRS